MGSSRTPPPPADPVRRAVEQGLRSLRAARAEAGLSPAFRIAVAVSGGRDSVCLLHALATLEASLVVLHVHHGLSASADDWLERVREQAGSLGLSCLWRHVEIPANERSRRGMEEAARLARHAALREMAGEAGAEVIALAHHRDDQAETVLLQALRGAGLPGLSAMPALARERLPWTWRPRVDVPRVAIDDYVSRHCLPHVDDPSNTDTRHARNALRHAVLPVIERHFPGWRDTLARVAGHAAEAQARLDAQTREDLRGLLALDGVEQGGVPSLDPHGLRALPASRARAALRAWVSGAGLRAPSAARLEDWLRQIGTARPGAALLLRHEGRVLRSRQGRLWLDLQEKPTNDQLATVTVSTTSVPVRWRGEACLPVPDLGGRLCFDAETRAMQPGVPATLLRSGALVLRLRRGGERLRTRARGPGRTLKNLYQSMAVPAWTRASLPLLEIDGRLAWAAGIGPDAAFVAHEGERLQLRWEREPSDG